MLFNLGPYELLVIAGVFLAITAGPLAAAAIVAWVRRRREKRRGP